MNEAKPSIGDIQEKLKGLEALKRKAKKLTGGKPGRQQQFSDQENAQRNRERNLEQVHKKTRAGQKIERIPPVKDLARKESCRLDFHSFCLEYLGFIFDIPFCADHHKVISKIEESVLRGGLFALAMPRGSGKTTLCLASCIWAILYGHRRFVFMLGATADHASEQLNNFRWLCEDPEFDELADDFPEAIFPIRALDGESKKQGGQRDENGDKTGIHWGGEFVVMPRVPDGEYYEKGKIEPSRAAGARIHISGITGRVRGFNIKKQRPDFFIGDDPQTNASANSASQCVTRERVLAGVAIGLAGPRKKIAGILPGTVIRAGDTFDNILSHEKHPEWDSSRTRLVYSFPTKLELWEKYKEIRIDYHPDVEGSKTRAETAASMFYAERQAEMDEGAVVAWQERYNPDEFSAVQNAMNLYFQDLRAFQAEYQNDPMPEIEVDANSLKPDYIAAKINGYERGIVPLGASRLTAFIDVQKDVLFFTVAAWADDFSGDILAYGTWPKQQKAYFNLHDLTDTLASATGVEGLEAQLHAGLTALTSQILGVEWQREDNTGMRVERCLIDARWGESTDIVYAFCRASAFRPVIMPSFGKGVGASSNQLTAREKKPGERFGLNWVITKVERRAIQHALYDTNFFKSFLMARWRMAPGSKGGLSLFGKRKLDGTPVVPGQHRLYADHLTAESPVKVTGRGRDVDEWKLPPGARNDWLDCTVGCAVAASIQGVSLLDVHPAMKVKAQAEGRKSWSAMKKQAEAK